jgi:Lectin C-type domain.
MRFATLSILFLFWCAPIFAEKKEEPQPLPQFKSHEAREALKTYRAGMRLLNNKHKSTEETFRNRLIGKLQEERVKATQADDLDEALKLRAAIEQLSNGGVVPEDKKPVKKPAGAVEFRGHWYYVSSSRMTWHAARAKCESVGGYLARVESRDEQRFLVGLLQRTKGEVVWIDGSDEANEGEWRYSDGSRVRTFFWGSGQPNNVDSKEHHLAVSLSNGTWLDVTAGQRSRFVCEWNE